MVRRTMAAAAVALVLTTGGATAQDRSTLRVGMGSADIGSLDPHRSTSTPDLVLFPWIFNGLVRFRQGSMDPETIEPDLAESWDRSADGKTWTFRLRRGVMCHHGYGELTSADVTYSLARAADPARSSFASDYAAVQSVEAPDAYTVRIVLKNPVPSLLGMMVNNRGGNIVCRRAAEELGEAFRRKPVGTGPFQFDQHVSQQSLTLAGNQSYFRGAPALSRIVYRFIPSDAARDLAYTAGEIDLTYGRSEQAWVDRMAKLPDTVVDVHDPAELGLLILNVTRAPLDDIRVRQAIATAVNRPELVRFRGEAIARAGQSVVPIGYLGMTSDLPLIANDPARARALLREAGYPNGLTTKSIVTNLSNGLTLMQVVQGQLARGGITLEMEVVEHAAYHARIRQDLSPVVYYSAARFPTADIYLQQFFHSSAIVGRPTAVTNFSHCDLADAEIDAAAIEPDEAKQKALWAEAQRKLVANVCAIPLIEVPRVWARRASLDYGFKLEGSLSNGPPLDERSRLR